MPLAHTRIAINAGQLIIILQDREAATDEQWSALMNDVKAARAALAKDRGQVLGLVISDGGAPNARQRSALAVTLDGQLMRAGVLSDSTLVRGAVTAMAWFNQGSARSRRAKRTSCSTTWASHRTRSRSSAGPSSTSTSTSGSRRSSAFRHFSTGCDEPEQLRAALRANPFKVTTC